MRTPVLNSTVLAVALTLALSPLVAFGQTDTSAQSNSADLSSQPSDSSAKSESDSESTAGMSGDEQKQDASNQGESADGALADSDLFISTQNEGEMLSANLVGAYVNDSNGESLGSVQNVLIDKDRKIRALVVGVGGFLGVGAKSVAVDFDKFEHSRAEDGSHELVLPATADQLQNAPTFKSMAQQELDQRNKERQQNAEQNMDL